MVSFLLIISFLLHILTLYAIFVLFKQVNSQQRADTTEITELFESYLEEIKEENSRLQKELQKKNSSEVLPFNNKKEGMADEPANQEPTKQEPDLEPIIEVGDMNDAVEASLEAKVLQLHHQGLSITEIAKRLNCGKTEAELIIRLHQKNM
ncbi:DUF6115 domain-containing protein [Oceanobacillus salinisoli]|uniref:DUF6115 domain-containing protein n=1 Tax=Oceanobacillus salinisoli TaxID=2678611 RepID=UPI0012E22D8C|nr:hypothetical protein [Oceanobacillus salinisoli]